MLPCCHQLEVEGAEVDSNKAFDFHIVVAVVVAVVVAAVVAVADVVGCCDPASRSEAPS